MAEISGSLASIELVPLVRLLTDLSKSGDLLVANQHWVGQLSFDHGRLVGAAIADEVGPEALEFIAVGMYAGEFEFSEGPPTFDARATLGADALALLEEFASPAARGRRRILPNPTAVPRLAAAPQLDEEQVSVERAVIYVLLAIDGQRTVREIAARYGPLQTVKALARLTQLGLLDTTSLDAAVVESLPPTAAAAARADGRQSLASLRQLRDRFTDLRTSDPAQRAIGVGLELGQAVLVVGVLVFSIRLLIQNFRVEGVSMQPTFEAGQVLVVNRAAYFHLDGLSPSSPSYVFGGPQRGDVAVFRAPPQPDTDYIKRIIGLPGDSIAVRDGRVLVNGAALTEPYIEFPADYTFPTGDAELVVPPGSYFVLGDNRPESFDSHFGWLVPVDDLIGRAWIRYWPPNELAIVEPTRPVFAAVATDARSQPVGVNE